jgi:HPt (histidine-containing phosphotransfer) domain-containing protein
VNTDEVHQLLDETLFDYEQIDMLIESGGDEAAALLREIVDLYLEESELAFTQLAPALEGRDGESVRRLAHSLAGSSANIGARKVWADCKELEKLADEGKVDQFPQTTTDLKATFDTTLKALQQLIVRLEA